MTKASGSQRVFQGSWIGLCGVLLWLAVGCAGGPTNPDGFVSDVSVVQMTSSNVEGKNVYLPSTVVVAGGAAVTLKVYNTTDTPHGFSIDGLGVEEILQPGVETEIPLPPLAGRRIYRIHCQLHPPHRGGTLVVMPGL